MTTEDDAAPVTFGTDGRIGRITLNRPATLNAFTPAMHGGLMAAFDALEADPDCRAILLTGAGRGFCSGQDLRERDPRKMDAPPDLSMTVGRYYNTLVRRVRGCDKPLVCAVNGVAAGAGVGLALACDIALAAEDAVFAFSFARIGLVPDAGTSWALVRRLGEARAMALTLTGGRMSGAEAARLGLIAKAVAAAALAGEAEELAQTLAAGPAECLRLSRRAIRAAATQTLDEQLELERLLQGQAGRHPDYGEGVLAYLEKRPARFAGVPAGQG